MQVRALAGDLSCSHHLPTVHVERVETYFHSQFDPFVPDYRLQPHFCVDQECPADLLAGGGGLGAEVYVP